jgi:pimeloyl-ACP methyl ester carboxylesterase
MPYLTTDDGIRLYYEETGNGTAIVFVHEFAGDACSWEPQVRFFSGKHRCVTFNARGYPPSDVPNDVARYSQERARDDIRSVMDALDIAQGHFVGLSMGAFAALHFVFEYPARALSLVIAGCGYGAAPEARAQFAAEAEAAARQFEQQGMTKAAETYALGPTRVQFRKKNPRAWKQLVEQLAGHSATGSALTMRGVQMRRPSLYDLTGKMQSLKLPVLILTGDEDWPCLEPALLMKRMIPTAALAVLPNSGHTLNLEEPEAFNSQLATLFDKVEAGSWPERDPHAMSHTILGR